MPRWLLFLIFFTVAVLILGGVHYYFYRRLVLGPALPAPWGRVFTLTLLLLAVCFPISFLVQRTLGVGVGRYFLFPIYIWLGVMLMLFFVLLLTDIVLGLGWIGARLSGRAGLFTDPARKLLVARVVAAGAFGLVAVAAAIGTWRGLARLEVRSVDVRLRGLPAAMDGFTIVQLTDLHLGAMRSASWFDDVVTRTNALQPDLIAITGDFADAPPAALGPGVVAALRRLQAPHGVFFVTGNHEYFIDLQGWLDLLKHAGVRVLRNERVPIRRGDAVFDLAGIDDHDGARLASGHGANVARALSGRDERRPVVLLAHQPRAIHDAAEQGVGLVLAGHTHGGQIWPWKYLVYLQQPYVAGLHSHAGTMIYVSQGTGFWGPPIRLGSTNEIARVRLRSARASAGAAPATTGGSTRDSTGRGTGGAHDAVSRQDHGIGVPAAAR